MKIFCNVIIFKELHIIEDALVDPNLQQGDTDLKNCTSYFIQFNCVVIIKSITVVTQLSQLHISQRKNTKIQGHSSAL